ncbi:Hypothetical_protein [Hexamita inflata]|uniref:Hypothetical_protein n=1 Tax=Hexamita inflata TaxID=28002 RepID=A0AA86N8E8_9EUKA|nr:Hypothetical protein HINF_LOCUS2403 [Hexamita inflata]CAI9914760.1 Hypothetical protein HINF_LOCUS2405 [Hexamita inflata]CAI9914762.1 Hypothetical protein HINF_LOCUS2407 [Hexamita inflata]
MHAEGRLPVQINYAVKMQTCGCLMHFIHAQRDILSISSGRVIESVKAEHNRSGVFIYITQNAPLSAQTHNRACEFLVLNYSRNIYSCIKSKKSIRRQADIEAKVVT